MRIIDHIPPDIVDIENVARLAEIFSGLQDYKNIEVSRLYHYVMNTSLSSNEGMNKMVRDLFSLNVPPEVPRRILRNLIQVADSVLQYRGTPNATTIFLRALTGGFVVNNYFGYYNTVRSQILLLNDDFNGYFPDGDDLQKLYDDQDESGIYYLYFDLEYDDSIEMSYNLAIISPYSKYEDFRKWVADSFVLHVKKNELDTERFKFFFYDFEILGIGFDFPAMYDFNPMRYE